MSKEIRETFDVELSVSETTISIKGEAGRIEFPIDSAPPLVKALSKKSIEQRIQRLTAFAGKLTAFAPAPAVPDHPAVEPSPTIPGE